MGHTIEKSMAGPQVRAAVKGDAAAITILADIAGYGLPCWLWSNSSERRPSESVLAFGRRRVLRDVGAFSYRNAHVAELDGEVAGLLIGYRQPDEADAIPDDSLETMRPLLELEAEVPGTWYVNILAVFEEFRGRRIGKLLLEKANALAEKSDARGLSIIVEDDNPRAFRLYEREGFSVACSRPFARFAGCGPAASWILMTKPSPTPPAE